MKVLVVGSGGREHALVWGLRRSPGVEAVYCAPGNPGMESLATMVPIDPGDLEGLARFVRERDIELTVVGPERPLADGIVDLFAQHGLRIFGPTRAASRLEWSKAFAKDFMARNGIPTAASRTFHASEAAAALGYVAACSIPVVIKADGLAAGKGVLICRTREEAAAGVREMFQSKAFGSAGDRIVFEEFMEGTEASVFAVSDGQRYVLLPPAQDHKRVFDDDQGKNTGGMGAFAPTPFVTRELLMRVEREIVRPTLAGMAREGTPYRGCLYVGLMLTKAGPRVVEYNARFGDPETQVVIPLFDGDLGELLFASAAGSIPETRGAESLTLGRGAAVCVVLASGGYPDAYATGLPVSGLEQLTGRNDVVVFHAGTRRAGGDIVTAGGRVLGVTAVIPDGTMPDAVTRAYEAVSRISFDGMHCRRDIGRTATGAHRAAGEDHQKEPA